jgi:hypothetical protein
LVRQKQKKRIPNEGEPNFVAEKPEPPKPPPRLEGFPKEGVEKPKKNQFS